MALQKSTKQLRVWGKILGREKDYWIAEGIADGGEEGEVLPNVEPRGQYVNKFTYYVSNDLLEDWVELPLA